MYKRFFKRVFDISISIVLLPFIFLALLFFGIIVFIDDRGRIIYASERLGKDMKMFKMYKIRTMRVDAPDIRNEDGSTFNSENDPRVTIVGKFLRKLSIDELPQIFNVLIGNMSLVGPRPDLLSQKDIYINQNKDLTKFHVKPGITGYAQVNGRNAITWDDKTKLDSYYANNVSFFMDIKILIKTVLLVFLRKNVNKY